MGLSNGPADTPVQAQSSSHDGETAPQAPKPAPKWLREGARPRRMVPLRSSSSPQSASSTLPVPYGTPPRAIVDMPADEGVAVKRLLQRSPEPKLAPVQAVPDPVGLALGVIARLIFAGSAAAAIAMLLFGIVPLPFQLRDGAASSKIEERFGADGNAMALPPARVTTVTVRPPQPVAPSAAPPVAPSAAQVAAPPARPSAALPAAPPAALPITPPAVRPAASDSALNADEIERLVKRGEDYLAHGDIAAARLVLTRAADSGAGRAAFSLAQTYDPSVLKRLNVLGFKADVAQARAWYEKAAASGSTEATRRLGELPNR